MAGRKKGKFQQTVRVLRMLEELRLHHAGLTVQELADHFEITTRQVRRDLGVLEEAGHALEMDSETGEGTRARLLDVPLKSVQLSLRERYALLAVRRVFDVLEHTPLHEDVRSVYAKIARGMPSERAQLDELEERFVYLPDGGRKLYARKREVLDGLMTGVLRRSRVAYEYSNAQGKVHKGTLAPYAMVLYKHGLYVVGTADGQTTPRVFAVERFRRAEYKRGERFEVPAGFRVEGFFDGAFGIFVGGERTKVVVELSKEVAEAVHAREWHPTQKLVKGEDGAVRIHMEVTNMTQVHAWVLGWGAHARVIEPASLAAQVAETARALLGRPGLARALPGEPDSAALTAG
jgi:predicted DNA-binding transcriptional regulator YafY